MKVHHIGVAVKSINDAAKYWEKLGFRIDHRQLVESQSVEVAFLLLGNVWLELVQPVAERTPLTNFLQKRGDALHHICFEVGDIEKEVDSAQLIAQPVRGFGDSKIAFAHPKEFGKVLVEYIENPPY